MLAVSVGFVFAAKPTKVDSQGNEVSWAHNNCTKIQDGTIVDVNNNIISVGYDAWGYNYQAHMFNGLYDNYARPDEPLTEGNTWLMMKWSDEWLANTDCNNDGKLDRGYSCNSTNPTSSACQGAWLTNHQWGSYLGNWNLTGDWVLEFDYLGRLYIHDMKVVDNTFTGTGGFPSGGPYSITWTVIGTIDGDNIEMTIDYDGSSYYVDVVGTIASDGTMNGTWSNQNQAGTWESTTGTATRETCNWDYFVKIVMVPEDAYKENGMWYTDNTTETEIGSVIWGAYARILQVENDPCANLEGVQYNSPSPTGFGYYR